MNVAGSPLLCTHSQHTAHSPRCATQVYKQLATVQAGRRDLLHARESVAAAARLAQSTAELEALNALQQSTSFESHVLHCAIGVGS